MPASVFGISGVGLTYFFVKKWIDSQTARFSALLLVFAPFHLWYSQEARMYSLLYLISVAVMWGYFEFINRPTRWVYALFLTISSLAYVTHYFALFLPLVQFIHLIIHFKEYYRKLKIWAGLQFMASVPLLMWIYSLSLRSFQHFGIGWIPEPTWKDLGASLVNFTIGYFQPLGVLGWIAVICLLLLMVLGTHSLRKDRSILSILILWAFFPPLVVFILSMRRAFYVDRFLILSLPALLILLGAGVIKMGNKKGYLVGGIILLLFAGRSYQVLSPAYNLTKENWRQAIEYISRQAATNEMIVLRRHLSWIPLQYYLKEKIPVEIMQMNQFSASLDEITAGYDGAWLVYWNQSADAHVLSSSVLFDPAKEVDPTAEVWISGRGPDLRERVDYNGVTLFHFILDP